jgi:hypothetical protein
MEIDDFIPKKDFERILFDIVKANKLVFNNPNVINISTIGDVPIFDIQGITPNSSEMFINLFGQHINFDYITKKVSQLDTCKNCVIVVIGGFILSDRIKNNISDIEFITFTYQFSDAQMTEFLNS